MINLKLLLMAPKRHWEDPNLVAWQLYLFFVLYCFFGLGKNIVGYYKFNRHFNKKIPLYVKKGFKLIEFNNNLGRGCLDLLITILKGKVNKCSKRIDLKNIF